MFAWLLGASALVLLAPIATAQSSATLELPAEPPAPNEGFVAVFRVPPGLVDIALQDHVACQLILPSGEEAACDWRGDVVTLRVLPTEVEYLLPLVAPPTPGTYALRVTRSPFADTAVRSVSAEAQLTVAPLEVPEDLAPGDLDEGTDATPPVSGGGTTNIWNIIVGRDAPASSDDPDASDDAERWMVSSTVGSAALLALVVAGRRGGLP